MEIERVVSGLPSKLEDLAQFVLIGRDKLAMVRAGIKALDKLDMAQEVRQQKKEEAQMLAEALMDAEVRIGEILLAMPKASGKHENRANQYAGGKILTSEESSTLKPAPKPEPKPIETKQEAAQKLGFNKQQVERFQTLAKNKDIVEQVKQEARANDDLATRTAVLQAVKVREKEKVHEERKQEYAERIEEKKLIESRVDIYSIDKKFRVIYADPPWQYDDPQDNPNLGGAQKHYNTMPIEDLCALPVKQIADKDAVLFLWITSPKLNLFLQLMEAWGFEYKTSFVWDKIKHNMGHYNSVRHEFLLIGGRGKSTPDLKRLYDSVISIERSEKHSEKPIDFVNMIDELYQYGDRIELFARQAKKENWYFWGNEV